MSATHAVGATSAWLQERDIGHEELLHQMSTAAVTPGATARVEAAFVFLESAQESVAILLQFSMRSSRKRSRALQKIGTFARVGAADVFQEFTQESGDLPAGAVSMRFSKERGHAPQSDLDLLHVLKELM